MYVRRATFTKRYFAGLDDARFLPGTRPLQIYRTVRYRLDKVRSRLRAAKLLFCLFNYLQDQISRGIYNVSIEISEQAPEPDNADEDNEMEVNEDEED